MAELKLLRGEIATVDDDMYPMLSQWQWHLHSNGYVIRTTGTHSKREVYWLHRVVLGVKCKVDHKDGNRLNNRQSNLRPASTSQNGANRRKSLLPTSSKFKGVQFRPTRKGFGEGWEARIKHKDKTGKQVYLGFFKHEIDAAKAYNAAAEKLFGEFALLNPV